MSGDIIVKSQVGKGSCFYLRIAIIEGKRMDVEKQTSKIRVIGLKPGQKGFQILIADDNYENRKFLNDMLLNIGFIVLEAENGLEAVNKFSRYLPDLILMDLNMSIMDGYEASKKIKSISKKKPIPIIAVTASAFAELKEKILKSGIDGIITKPFKEQELFDILQTFLGVEYIYETEKHVQKHAPLVKIKKALSNLPEKLIIQMLAAAKNLEANVLLKVIDQVEKFSSETAVYLREIAKKYQYDLLIKILQETRRKK